MKKATKQWYDAAILKEDEQLTTAKSKHFILNNGTRKAVFSASDINYFDKAENKWKAIDNSLKSTGAGYQGKLGNYMVTLSNTSGNESVEVSDGDSTISWKYLGTHRNIFAKQFGKAAAPAVKRQSKLKVHAKLQDSMKLHTAGQAVFQGADGDVDLDYRIEGNSIKENIVVKDKSESYSYYFTLHVSGFTMKPSEDGKEIAFFKVREEPEETETTEKDEIPQPDFIMQSPCMSDSAGNASDLVQYKMEGAGDGDYIFSVNADSEWINAPERVFPVQIDPQLSVSGETYMSITQKQYLYESCSSCSSGQWCDNGQVSYGYIYLERYANRKVTATVRIKRNQIDLSRYRVISAKLIFTKYGSESVSDSVWMQVGNQRISNWGNTVKWSADITSLYKSGTGDLNVNMEITSVGYKRKFSITPTLEIEYQPISTYPILKNIAAAAGANVELDVLTGNGTPIIDNISDPALGVSVSHVYKPNGEFTEYGKNFRLNLDEKLVKSATTTTGAEYVYTDPSGNKHTFKEHFYKIGANGEKIAVTANVSSILADSNGQLWLGNEQVFRELTTVHGLRATARLEGVNNAEWLEQRMDEEKQLEEQVKSYENTLTNFVLVHKEDGHTTDTLTSYELSNPDAYETFINNRTPCCSYLLSKEEALSYKSLLTQKAALVSSKTALGLQKESLKHQAKGLAMQYYAADALSVQEYSNSLQKELLLEEYRQIATNREMNNKTDEKENPFQKLKESRYFNQVNLLGHLAEVDLDYTKFGLWAKQVDLTDYQKLDWAQQKELIKSQISKFPLDVSTSFSGYGKGTLVLQYENLQEQINVIDKQISDLNKQIDLLADKSTKYTSQLNTVYKEYRNLKSSYALLKLQIPVAYLLSEHAIKGYNAQGNLVLIQDQYGNYLAVEREFYTQGSAARIKSVYNQDGKTMRFIYHANKLSEIINSLGERTTFEYDSGNCLTAVNRETLPSLTLTYASDRIQKISSSDHSSAAISYSVAGLLNKISLATTVQSISNGITDTAGNTTLSTLTVDYTGTDTKITTDGTHSEIYKVNLAASQVNAYYEVVNNFVSHAEKYTYNGNLRVKTETAAKSNLNRYSYASFASYFAIESVETVTYNTFEEPVLVVSEQYKIPRTTNDTPIKKLQTEYLYNRERKLMKTRSSLWIGTNQTPTVTVEAYRYNSAGSIVRSESYIEGEETLSGIQVKEHVYNDKGIEIQTCTYNTLDPSSKIYTESKLDETGRTIAELDSAGEHSVTYDYDSDGISVKTEHLPNGSKFSYGRAKNGTVTAITHSTAEGEENSTRKSYTADLVTEVQSGNNTVRYSYDKKQRVTSVSLNGTDNYATIAYTGDNTNAQKVTVTLANQPASTVSTCIKDFYGNVIESTCGNAKVVNTPNNTKQRIDKTVEMINNAVTRTTVYQYDDQNNLKSVKQNNAITEQYEYTDDNLIESQIFQNLGYDHTYTYGYGESKKRILESISLDNGAAVVRPKHDVLGRNTGKSIAVSGKAISEEQVSYLKFGDHATNLPATVRYANNVNGSLVFKESLQYRYDCMGNIVEVLENGRSIYKYEYDALGRLTREDNQAFKTTKQYVYDNNGNIIAKYQYPITTTPTNELQWLTAEKSTQYGYATNSDRLMTYGAETFAYDAIGNPTTYRGKTATWQNGRQLTAYNGTTFAYDARGRRTQKNTLTFTYDSKGNLLKQSNGLEFLYDHTGIFAVKQGNSTYYCRKNAQNDVMFLLDNNGTIVVKYRYDAWGVCKVLDVNGNEITNATHIGNLNPFRYRSYYYDTETNLYFLQSRYYDPEVGRFITIDDISYLDPDSINGLNLYAYCKNNPVIGYDPTGTWDWGTFWRALGSTLAIAGGIALCFVPGAQLIGAGLIIAGAGGLIGGAIGAATGAGFNYGWDIGTIIGGSIGLVVALPQLLSLSFTASIPVVSQMLTTAGELVLVTSSIAVAIPVGGAVAVAAGVGIVMFAKQSRKSKSDMSTDIPSWVNPKLLDPNKSAQQNVIDLLNEKYGPGNWRYGPDTEYNKIKKWLRRKLGWKG